MINYLLRAKCLGKVNCRKRFIKLDIKLDIDLPVKGSFVQCPSSNLMHQSCATLFLMLIL